MPSKLLLLAPRLLQLLSAAVVLGLSAHLYPQIQQAKDFCDAVRHMPDCDFKGLQPSTGFAAFVGAFGVLDALAGAAVTLFLAERVRWILVGAVDGLAALFYLAGGIALAVILGNNTCNGTNGACSQLKADAAFLFIGFLATLAVIVMGFLWQRGGSRGVGVSGV